MLKPVKFNVAISIFNVFSTAVRNFRRCLPLCAAAAMLSLMLSLMANSTAWADIRIAFVGQLSGPRANFGTAIIEGQKAAIERLNAAGGLLGEKVEVAIFDDQCNPEIAAQVAEQILSGGFQAVIGHACTSAALAAAKIYDEGNLLLISPGVEGSDLTERSYRHVFRVVPRLGNFARLAAEYGDRLSNKAIGIIAFETPFYQKLATLIEKEANELGVKVIGRFNGLGDDFGPAVALFVSEKVPLVVLALPTTMAGKAAQRLREADPRLVPLILGYPLPEEERSALGKGANGIVSLAPPDPREQPSAAPAIELLLAQYGDPVEIPALYGFAAVEVWAQAVQMAGAYDSAELSDALRKNSFESVLGPLQFDGNGDVIGLDYGFYLWRDGERSALTSYRGRPPPPPPPPP